MDEVIEATLMDRRWRFRYLILWTQIGTFRQKVLVAFRKRLIEGQMDRRLIERTIEIASQSQTFGPRALALLWIVVRCGGEHGSWKIRVIGSVRTQTTSGKSVHFWYAHPQNLT